MTYQIDYTPVFAKHLRKLDRPIQRRVLAALTALGSLDDPTAPLKPLRHSKTGLWRLRVGDYRVILSVRNSELVVLAMDVGHRSTIYDE